MKLRGFCLCALSVLLLPILAPDAFADTLLTAGSFAVLGEAGVTNASGGGSAATIITGDLGGSIGTPAITGFPPGIVNGTTFSLGAPNQAFLDLTTAYTNLGTLPVTATLGADLGGLTVNPGVYVVPAGATNLSSVLTLDDKGVAGSTFVFLLSSTLITSTNSSVDISKLHPNDKVFWVVRSSAELGPNSDFAGNILALAGIAFDPGATDLCGRALSQTASVSFAGVGTTIEPGESAVEANQVGGSCPLGNVGGSGGGTIGGGNGGSPGGGLNGGGNRVPEPGTLPLLLAGGLISLGLLSKRLLLS